MTNNKRLDLVGDPDQDEDPGIIEGIFSMAG